MANHPAHVRLARKLLEGLDGLPFAGERPAHVPALHYTSEERFALEQREVFAKRPQPVAHVSELANIGDTVTAEVAGIPLIVVRGPDGAVRAFRNACRHRGTRLVSEPCSGAKAFVCRYHAWTYDLTGQLTHAPHRETFCGEEKDRDALVSAHAAEACGFIWASLAPVDLNEDLGPLHDELDGLQAGQWRVFRRHAREAACNWKLLFDAFLEAYHVRRLHRESVGRFFLDSRFEAERVGPHVRAATARKGLAEAKDVEAIDVRRVITPSYHLFPCSVFVLHPDFASLLTMVPLSAGRSRFTHTMFLDREGDAAHWDKSFELIDGGVFGSEDLAICEEIQQGLKAQADESVLFGQLEAPAGWFHQTLAQRLGR
jgi:glycine betaine catabolism A